MGGITPSATRLGTLVGSRRAPAVPHRADPAFSGDPAAIYQHVGAGLQ